MASGKSLTWSRPNLYHLDENVWIQILVRLPIKSLLRFRSICKSWYSLITNPTFIKAHLNHQTNNTNLLLLNHGSEYRHNFCCSIRYDDESFGEYYEPKLPPLHLKSVGIYGCCNGLVCLSEDPYLVSTNIFFWNPALKKLKTLPKPPQIIDIPFNDSDHVWLSFGFHSQVNDYKVVRIVFLRRDMDDNPCKRSMLVEVYSLSTDSWRRIDASPPPCHFTPWPTGIFMNGAVYWTACKEAEDAWGVYTTLLRFEMGDEVFEEITVPDGAQHTYPAILVCRELLYLCAFDFGIDSGVIECCHMWTMESSKMGFWTKRFTVSFNSLTERLLAFRRNGELLKIYRNCELRSYNLEIQKSEDLGINAIPNDACAHSYVESLILVDGRGDFLFTD